MLEIKVHTYWKTMVLLLFAGFLLSGCTNPYYSAMEKVGIHKRDIMVDRVEDARNSQEDAQEQFKSALDQFSSVIALEDTDLKRAYESLNREYEDCVDAADTVSSRIDKVESVSDALFDEWEDEIKLYKNKDLARSSRKQLSATRDRYDDMMVRMRKAESSMAPVLDLFRDNVLYLKHNLNAQAIGLLQGEFASLEAEIDTLIGRMNEAIESSNAFIADMQAQ
jgi:chromosome segregation ATPase